MRDELENTAFDDEDLLRALRRALPPAVASPALRERVTGLIQEAHGLTPPILLTQSEGAEGTEVGESPQGPWSITRWLPTGRKLAIAASIAGLGLGMGLFLALDSFSTEPPQLAAVSTPVMADNVLMRHDQLQRSLTSGDRPALYSPAELEQQVQRVRIPHVDLSDGGWRFVGAKACDMGSSFAAQLFYTRGPQSLSVFIIPKTADSRPLSLSLPKAQGHRLAIRELNDTSLCVVGHSPSGELSQADVEALADTLAR